jgi:hypothetical protein
MSTPATPDFAALVREHHASLIEFRRDLLAA